MPYCDVFLLARSPGSKRPAGATSRSSASPCRRSNTDSINYVNTVTDFKQGGDADLISLAGITGPVLAFAGNAPTVTANSVNWFESGNITIVQADVNGNDIADFQLALRGTGLGLTATDFVL